MPTMIGAMIAGENISALEVSTSLSLLFSNSASRKHRRHHKDDHCVLQRFPKDFVAEKPDVIRQTVEMRFSYAGIFGETITNGDDYRQHNEYRVRQKCRDYEPYLVTCFAQPVHINNFLPRNFKYRRAVNNHRRSFLCPADACNVGEYKGYLLFSRASSILASAS